MTTKHQSVIDAETKIADKKAADIWYNEQVKKLYAKMPKNIRNNCKRPIRRGEGLWGFGKQKYWCPVHPEVELKKKYIQHKYNESQWSYTFWYDGCGYFYWLMWHRKEPKI